MLSQWMKYIILSSLGKLFTPYTSNNCIFTYKTLMKKATRLKTCNYTLLFLTIASLASSIQLEATHSEGICPVWLHIAVCLAFTIAVVWHLYLHFRWKDWIGRLRSQKSPVTRWLAIFGLLTFITAVVAFIHWGITYTHSPIGGVHGKLGFAFLALSIGHTVKRIKFFKR